MSTDDRSNPMFVREAEPKEFYRVDRPDPQLGFPELWWRGKRPFSGVPYYPAQHKESHGEPVDSWKNLLYWGDNLQVMGHLLRKHRGQVKLVYIDPPFDSKADYKRTIQLRGQSVSGDATAFEEKQYSDIWTNDEYLQFMFERLHLIRELMSPGAALYLHCDPRRSHALRIILDEIFGPAGFQNEIVWVRTNAHNMKSRGFVRANDVILYYCKAGGEPTFHEQYLPYGEAQLSRYQKDEDGRLYTSRDMTFSTVNPARQFEWRGTRPPPNRSWGGSFEQLEKWWSEGRILTKKDGTPRLDGLKVYLEETKGNPLSTAWTDIARVGNTSGERLDYPTQKPEVLLERILKVSTDPGDLVFDCFMGSGTTQAVSMRLGRRFIGADINLGSIQTATKRLLGLAAELRKQPPQLFDAERSRMPVYTGMDTFTVNQYDIFRNEPEARSLLMEALAIRPLPGGDVWHGELGEGAETRLVHFMPINRIATRADLDPIIKNLDWKLLTRRRAELPNKPVLRASLVCMGHEPELGGLLALEVRKGLGDSGAKLDIEVVDILRDKDHLEFKRDSHAQVRMKKGKLAIEKFYPMNLLQKLSMDKTAVSDWRELVESVFVDFNYDGKVLRPAITDVAEGNDLVKGEYDVPKGAGVIRVKITDLLSDVLELNVEVEHG